MEAYSSNDNYILNLCIKIYREPVPGLFSYEPISTIKSKIVLDDDACLIRKGDEIIAMKKDPFMLSYDEIYLFNVNNDIEGNFFLESSSHYISGLKDRIWYLIKSDPDKRQDTDIAIPIINDDYYLCNNDVIKLGDTFFSFNEIHIPSKLNNINRVPPLTDTTKYDIHSLNKNTGRVFNFIYDAKDASQYNDIPKEEKRCKICLFDKNDRKNNPLVNLCNCKGGLGLSHYICLRKWMKSKLYILENEKKTVKTYYVVGFNCEICKTAYPLRFLISGIEYPFELIKLDKPIGCNYIILESSNLLYRRDYIKSIHIIKLTNDELVMGYHRDCDIKIFDNYIANKHAILKYNTEKGTLLIRDLKTQYGTLVLIKKPLLIKEKKIQIQCGSAFIEANIINKDEYNKQQEKKKAEK